MAKRDYDNDYPSVTQVLGILRKPGLENWYINNTPQFIREKTSKSKIIGTQTHEAIQYFIETGKAKIETEFPDEVTFALKSFMKFREENPETKLSVSEIKLTSNDWKFNGTIDAPHPPILYDWKSGEAKEDDIPKIWPEWKFQVSAYVYLWNENNPNNLISEAHIVAIAKDKVAYVIDKMEMPEITACFEEVFLPCLKIYNYQRKEKKNAV